MEKVMQILGKLADEVAQNLDIEVYDVELIGQGRRSLLRVTLDKQSGVLISDCESFSRDFAALMDVEDPIEGEYTLEVSSPGLDRPLKKLRDYQKSIGKLIKVFLLEKRDGKSFVIGRLEELNEEGIKLSTEKDTVEITFAEINKARLEIEF